MFEMTRLIHRNFLWIGLFSYTEADRTACFCSGYILATKEGKPQESFRDKKHKIGLFTYPFISAADTAADRTDSCCLRKYSSLQDMKAEKIMNMCGL